MRAACCASFVLITSAVSAQPPSLLGGAFAEGYASPGMSAPVQIAHRAFTTTSRECEGLQVLPTRFEPSPSEIVLRVGQGFSIPSIVVRALDNSGTLISKMPIAAAIWYEAGVLDFQSDQSTDFSIVGERPGKGGLIIRALCGDELEITIPIRIVP